MRFALDLTRASSYVLSRPLAPAGALPLTRTYAPTYSQVRPSTHADVVIGLVAGILDAHCGRKTGYGESGPQARPRLARHRSGSAAAPSRYDGHGRDEAEAPSETPRDRAAHDAGGMYEASKRDTRHVPLAAFATMVGGVCAGSRMGSTPPRKRLIRAAIPSRIGPSQDIERFFQTLDIQTLDTE